MDPDIEELKEQMRRNIRLSEQTNRMVRSMYREAMWSKVFKFIWMVCIVIFAVYAYYYVKPYTQKIEQLYIAAQTQLTQIKSIGNKIPGQ